MKIETEKIGIYQLEELKSNLLKKIENSNSININLTNVKKIELSAIQLFISLKKSCDEKKIKLTFSNLNEDVFRKIEISGCSSFLGV